MQVEVSVCEHLPAHVEECWGCRWVSPWGKLLHGHQGGGIKVFECEYGIGDKGWRSCGQTSAYAEPESQSQCK